MNPCLSLCFKSAYGQHESQVDNFVCIYRKIQYRTNYTVRNKHPDGNLLLSVSGKVTESGTVCIAKNFVRDTAEIKKNTL